MHVCGGARFELPLGYLTTAVIWFYVFLCLIGVALLFCNLLILFRIPWCESIRSSGLLLDQT